MHNRNIQIDYRRVKTIVLVPMLLAILLVLSSCFGNPRPPQIAATVNGEIIEENTVTEFIEAFRAKNTQYETDLNWVEFMTSNGYTPETLRAYVLNNIFIPQELIKQQCVARDIQVGDTDLDTVISRERRFYEQRYGDNSWDSVLASYGYDEDSWRKNELNRLLEEKLCNQVIGEVVLTQSEIQTQANQSCASYNGKNSYFITFASQEEAENAYNHVASNNGKITLNQFNRLGHAEHAGWNSLPAARDNMSKEYIQASNDLALNSVSHPVQINNSWTLIYCNQVFNADPNNTSIKLKDVPKEIYDQVVTDAKQTKRNVLLEEWLRNLASQSDIKITPMPFGLSYDISDVSED